MIRKSIAASAATGAVAVAVAGTLALSADAQTAAVPPVVSIQAGGATPVITGADALGAGPTTFKFSTTGKGEAGLAIVQLNPGVTPDQLSAFLSTEKGAPTAEQVAKFGALVAGGDIAGASTTSTVTTTLAAGTDVLVDTTKRPKAVGSFTVGATPTGAVAPTPVKTVVFEDFKFGVPGNSLPTSGVVRFVNNGDSIHFAELIKVASPAVGKQLIMALKMGDAKKSQKLAKGFYELASPISPGVTVDATLPSLKKGSYVLSCFWADADSHGKEHSMLGMVAPVTVK